MSVQTCMTDFLLQNSHDDVLVPYVKPLNIQFLNPIDFYCMGKNILQKKTKTKTVLQF